jgi:hypothetical protein
MGFKDDPLAYRMDSVAIAFNFLTGPMKMKKRQRKGPRDPLRDTITNLGTAVVSGKPLLNETLTYNDPNAAALQSAGTIARARSNSISASVRAFSESGTSHHSTGFEPEQEEYEHDPQPGPSRTTTF